jgi:protein-S-isoprenylcysteine O-methyltransferase Ste14
MYFASILMFLFMPLLLGSYYALLPLLIFHLQMMMRIKNEEEVLEKGLDGYIEYKKKVKYKVIPYLW